jgi:hypothetical protein
MLVQRTQRVVELTPSWRNLPRPNEPNTGRAQQSSLSTLGASARVNMDI